MGYVLSMSVCPLFPHHTHTHTHTPLNLRAHAHHQVTLRLVEHFYFKTQAVYNAMRKLTMLQQQEAAAAAATTPAEDGEAVEEPDEVVEVKVSF